ncbi:MAG: hypothetical protein HC903_00580 [Methylacidiphilales bacterium]|nr:hypothetical protein [Candidatus Methylacidiphilales bacterium]
MFVLPYIFLLKNYLFPRKTYGSKHKDMQENHSVFSVPKCDRVLSLLPRYLSVARTITMCDRVYHQYCLLWCDRTLLPPSSAYSVFSYHKYSITIEISEKTFNT